MSDLIYKVALTLVPRIGVVTGKSLISYCGGAEAVFREKKAKLLKIPGIGEQAVQAVLNFTDFDRAQEEVAFIEENHIQPLFYTDKAYPQRLLQCYDSPLMLYYKGNTDLNTSKILAMVGTRKATEYGKDMCAKIVEGFKNTDVLIVSGLAYGIDTYSHKAALDNNLNTVGVLGHGLDRVYPATNKPLSEKMLQSGGLLTTYMKNTNPDRENFPQRNRIVAGISDAVLVVEAAAKGGALLTAEYAIEYNRDVFAVPARLTDMQSEGCNRLIKINKAALVQDAEDIKYIMNWQSDVKPTGQVIKDLFSSLSAEHQIIFDILHEKGEADIDLLLLKTGFMPSMIAKLLLDMEFDGIIKCLPGKIYRLTVK